MSTSSHRMSGGFIRISGPISIKRPGDYLDKPPYPSESPFPQFR